MIRPHSGGVPLMPWRRIRPRDSSVNVEIPFELPDNSRLRFMKLSLKRKNSC